tara:strand:- start:314 stop:577 length:264 start_codon:yes stop_codon:yes gene_type:complete
MKLKEFKLKLITIIILIIRLRASTIMAVKNQRIMIQLMSLFNLTLFAPQLVVLNTTTLSLMVNLNTQETTLSLTSDKTMRSPLPKST